MNPTKIQACSGLVHKFEENICSVRNFFEIKSPKTSTKHDNNEIKNEKEDEEKKEVRNNEIIASSDISTSTKQQIETDMGNKIFKTNGKRRNFTELTEDQIELLVSSTKFSAQQVREWHQSFLHECPSGKLDRKRFIEVYQQFYPQGKASQFCSLAFRAFDRDRNGIVDFNEFLLAIALTMSGELRDRLGLAFSIYDINGDGVLDKKELTQIIKLIYEMNGKKYVKDNITAQDKARMIIDKFDVDGDRKLSRDEFISGCLNNSDIRKLLTP